MSIGLLSVLDRDDHSEDVKLNVRSGNSSPLFLSFASEAAALPSSSDTTKSTAN